MHFLRTNVERRDRVISWLSKFANGKLKDTWDGVTPPCIVGNDRSMDEVQRVCNAKNIPYLYVDHAYFNRHADMRWFRLCVSNYHCTDWRDSDRTCKLKVHDWNPKGKRIVVIEPAKKVHTIHPVQAWIDATMAELPKYTDRKVVLKVKGEGDLVQTLQDAWAAVCFGSVADVDAVRLGIPVFTGPLSPAAPMSSGPLSAIESPYYPDRAQWLRSLASAEWSLKEIPQAIERVASLIDLC